LWPVHSTKAYLENALELYRSLGDAGGQASALINMGTTQHHRHDATKALALLSEALNLSRTSGRTALEAASLNAIGRAYANAGDEDRALESYKASLNTYQLIDDLKGNEEVLRNIRRLSHGKNR